MQYVRSNLKSSAYIKAKARGCAPSVLQTGEGRTTFERTGRASDGSRWYEGSGGMPKRARTNVRPCSWSSDTCGTSGRSRGNRFSSWKHSSSTAQPNWLLGEQGALLDRQRPALAKLLGVPVPFHERSQEVASHEKSSTSIPGVPRDGRTHGPWMQLSCH
jgi:hypothetical protein